MSSIIIFVLNHLVISGIVVYLLGAFSTYIADGWFNFSNNNNEELALLSWAWPLVVVLSPIFLGEMLRNKLRSMRRKRDAKIEQQVKIRVAQEKEIEKIASELDELLEEERQKYRAV